MDSRGKKLKVPIIVMIILVLYYVVYFGFLMLLLEGIWKYVLGIFPIFLTAVTVGVCIQRIKEIKEGEEDDLGKY